MARGMAKSDADRGFEAYESSKDAKREEEPISPRDIREGQKIPRQRRPRREMLPADQLTKFHALS